MSWMNFKRELTKPFTEIRLRRQVKQRFFYRDIMEVMRKREEFRVKQQEVSKQKNSNGDVKKYGYYIDLINWIINSKEDDTEQNT